MGPKNLLILFFSTVAVSLVILIIFFSLFFKSVNLDFNTRLPESAPDIGGAFNQTSTMSPDSKADGLMRSTVNVPSDSREADFGGKPGEKGNSKEPDEAPVAGDATLPPVSDDALLENEYPQPLPDKLSPPPLGNEKLAPPSGLGNDKTTTGPGSNRPAMTAPPPRLPRPMQDARRETTTVQPSPQPLEAPIAPEPEPQGPPVP